ncbi:MAG: hypothetical protein K8I29_06950 [Alphaproteobacteria bacterium]|uniref:Uncharacterized protein n=1 Tax=Candidatus Nitrobium versatile TaxID=2884831 RepID=A0A953J437_9BACT|nr:hypothetical protein [Candidatus Nitrobium versatile]
MSIPGSSTFFIARKLVMLHEAAFSASISSADLQQMETMISCLKGQRCTVEVTENGELVFGNMNGTVIEPCAPLTGLSAVQYPPPVALNVA